MCKSKNAGVAGYAEAFRPVQSDSQTSEWYSYFENDVLVTVTGKIFVHMFLSQYSTCLQIIKGAKKAAAVLPGNFTVK